MHDGKARIIDGLRNGNRLRIAVNCQQASFRSKLGEDQTRVTTATKSAINIDAVWTNIQAFNGLIQQHRCMFIIFHHIYRDKSRSRSDNVAESDCSASISSLTC